MAKVRGIAADHLGGRGATPSASRSPMPSRRAISSTSFSIAPALPKRRSSPPVSCGPISPCSKHSMAKDDGRAGRDRVEGVAVAQLVGLGDRLEVVDAAVGAEPADRLVLRPAVGLG